MSNAERQRRFRERHPGYFRKYDARNREIARKAAAKVKAAALARGAARQAELRAQQARALALPAPLELRTIPIPTQLMLPAPVEDLNLTALNAMVSRLREKVEIQRRAAA